MAVVLSAYDLLVRVDEPGPQTRAIAAIAPNQTFCTDGRIARLSFMTKSDRDHFVATARLAPGTFARADRQTESVDADWVEVGRHAGVVAAWVRGAPRDPLVVPISWAPGDVEAYLDRRTGRMRHVARTRPRIPDAELARLEALRLAGAELARPLLFKKKLGFFEKRRMKKAVALLEQVVAASPDQWSACWLLGMSFRALGEHERALDRFRRTYAVRPDNPDVGREYAAQCFIVGSAEEGVRISREVHARFPDDAGLQSNLALALLIGGDLDEAHSVAAAAHQRDPADPITKNLLDYIGAVRAGRKPRPTRMPGW